jgi:uncharacterized protein YgfB (UPF0149 family)
MAYGLTSGSDTAALDKWQTEICAECDPRDKRVWECQRLLMPLFEDAQQQAVTGSVPQLCLPPDDQSIHTRSVGFRDWCRGFLYGFGIRECLEQNELSASAREALHDIGELARLDPPQQESGEEDEAALMELQEYLRVAVLLIRGELNSSAPNQR